MVKHIYKNSEALECAKVLVVTWANLNSKNPAYRRQRISRPMRIVGRIKFWKSDFFFFRFFDFSHQKKCTKQFFLEVVGFL